MFADFRIKSSCGWLKKVSLIILIAVITTVGHALAEPSDCLTTTETDNWGISSPSSPNLQLGECVSDEQLFTVDGFYAPYSLWAKTSGAPDWSLVRDDGGEQLYFFRM